MITDDGRIRASLPTHQGADRPRRAGDRLRAPGPAQGETYAARAAGGPSLRPVAARLGELLGQPVPLAERRGRGVGRGPGGRAGRRRGRRCWRTSGSSRPRRARTTPSGPGSPPGWPRSAEPCTSATASAPCTASTPASTTCPRCSRTPPGTWSSPRSRCSASSPPTRPGPTWWCSAAPSRPTSWRSSATCSAEADRLIIGGGMCLHVPRGPGLRGGQVAAGGGPDPAGHRGAGRGGPARRGGRAAGGPGGRRPVRRRTPTTAWCRSASSRPTGRAWTSGPRPGRCSPQKLADARTVFWNGPTGRVRVPGVRRRNPGGGRGDQPRSAG